MEESTVRVPLGLLQVTINVLAQLPYGQQVPGAQIIVGDVINELRQLKPMEEETNKDDE